MRMLLALAVLAGLALAGDPSYRFAPGLELRFEGKGESFGQTVTSTCRVWVVRANDDGTFRLVLCLEPPGADAPAWAWCDMAPDGAYAENETTPHADPGNVLPLLPRADAAVRRRGPVTYRYRKDEPGVVAFDIESGESLVYGVHESIRLTLEAGLPAAVEKTLRRGKVVTGKGTMRLAERTAHDAAWTHEFAAQTDLFFEACRRYRETCDRAVLDDLIEATKVDGIRAGLRGMLAEHDERAEFEAKRRAAHGKLVGKASPDWTTEDLDGKKHALADYRGKVVVLDFWFRGCGWCVHSMPDVKEICARFKDRPVAVLGMNVDHKAEDARFVIDALELPYPNLEARDLRDVYAVMGYPTVVVIDTKGVVRRIHHGHWPALRTELGTLIDELLAEAE